MLKKVHGRAIRGWKGASTAWKNTQGGEGCVQTVRYKQIGTNRSREKIGRGRALHPSATGRALTVSIESSKIELHRRSTLWLPAVAPVKGTLCCSSVRISPHRRPGRCMLRKRTAPDPLFPADRAALSASRGR